MAASFSQINREDLLTVNPDIIVEFKSSKNWSLEQGESNKMEWKDIQISAVKNGAFYQEIENIIPGSQYEASCYTRWGDGVLDKPIKFTVSWYANDLWTKIPDVEAQIFGDTWQKADLSFICPAEAEQIKLNIYHFLEAPVFVDNFILVAISGDNEIKTVSEGVLNNTDKIINDLPAALTVAGLKAAITVDPKATFDVVASDATDAASVTDTETITDVMKVKVTAETGAVQLYAIHIVSSSSKEILLTTLGTIDGVSIIDIPKNTTVADLEAAITISQGANADILASDATDAASAGDAEIVTETMVIKVTAQDASTLNYTLSVFKSSEKAITLTTIGTLAEGNKMIASIPELLVSHPSTTHSRLKNTRPSSKLHTET